MSLTKEEEREGEGYIDPLDELPGEDWEEPPPAPRTDDILTRDMIRFGLSRIARTLDTFEFAYSRFECRKKDLSNIDILGKYIHLRMIDLGENSLRSCRAISTIPNLLMLNVEANRIESLKEIAEHPFLQALNLRNNLLTTSEGLFPNCLAYLQLGDNAIEDVYGLNPDVSPWLTVLELKGNRIRSLIGIDLPRLQRIYLAQNQLKDLNGLDGLPHLTHLHARDNNISKLKGFPKLEKLEYVNLRGNNLGRFTEMTCLGSAPNIKTLILMHNPFAQLSNYRLEVLTANPNLRRLDKIPVLETDMVEARLNRLEREQGARPSLKDDPTAIADTEGELELDEVPFPSTGLQPPTASTA